MRTRTARILDALGTGYELPTCGVFPVDPAAAQVSGTLVAGDDEKCVCHGVVPAGAEPDHGGLARRSDRSEIQVGERYLSTLKEEQR